MKSLSHFLCVVATVGLASPAWADQPPAGAPNPGSSLSNAPASNPPPATPTATQANATAGANPAPPPAPKRRPHQPAPGEKVDPNTKTTTAQPAPAPDATPLLQTAQPVPPHDLKFSDYLGDLTSALNLSKDEQTGITTYYETDGAHLKDILNNPTLSPLQQYQAAAEVRAARNEKIGSLLDQPERRRTFIQVEARYRVALTELAADGGLAPAQTPPLVATPTDTAPGQAEPAPNGKNAAK